MKSLEVSQDGYYQIDFNPQGVFLTKLEPEEINYLPMNFWAYMNVGQYIDGTDSNNWQKKPLFYTDDTLKSLYAIDSVKYDRWKKQEEMPPTTHKCQKAEYHGLFETDLYCKVCGVKQ